jgi:hypothetical protein
LRENEQRGRTIELGRNRKTERQKRQTDRGKDKSKAQVIWQKDRLASRVTRFGELGDTFLWAICLGR